MSKESTLKELLLVLDRAKLIKSIHNYSYQNNRLIIQNTTNCYFDKDYDLTDYNVEDLTVLKRFYYCLNIGATNYMLNSLDRNKLDEDEYNYGADDRFKPVTYIEGKGLVAYE